VPPGIGPVRDGRTRRPRPRRGAALDEQAAVLAGRSTTRARFTRTQSRRPAEEISFPPALRNSASRCTIASLKCQGDQEGIGLRPRTSSSERIGMPFGGEPPELVFVHPRRCRGGGRGRSRSTGAERCPWSEPVTRDGLPRPRGCVEQAQQARALLVDAAAELPPHLRLVQRASSRSRIPGHRGRRSARPRSFLAGQVTTKLPRSWSFVATSRSSGPPGRPST